MANLTHSLVEHEVPVRTYAPGCPRCTAPHVGPTLRRPFDRLISLVVPVRRYRCRNCGWIGNLTVSRK